MQMQFIDLPRQYGLISDKIEEAISEVLSGGQYIMGEAVHLLEKELEDFLKVRHAICCANGTDALTLALMATGCEPGDFVIVPAFTYVASAEAAAQLGATPVFVDVNEADFNINLDVIEEAIQKTKVKGRVQSVIAVDLFGQPCFSSELEEICRRNDVVLIIDAAQSLGSEILGKKTGNFGTIATTSFFPAKPLGCYGDGGAVFTNDDELAVLLKSLRTHGTGSHKYEHVHIGLNSRLDTVQAAVLREKLKIFPKEMIERQKVAALYTELLSKDVIVPSVEANKVSAWAQYTIRTKGRSDLQRWLKQSGIPSAVYYPIPLNEQEAYSKFPSFGPLTISKNLSEEVLSLPMHPYLEEEQIKFICDQIVEFSRQNESF
jgi:dTDP-4-amino-4,6-dideoxygalactose transaminase